LGERDILLTADTVVVVDNDILGKPASREEAVAMIRRMSGREHKVITGVTLRSKSAVKSFSVCSDVVFRALSDEEIAYYVDNYRPMDKAGAYGIQEWIGCIGVKNINGSFYNVMGLPLHRLYSELKSF
jgi:septum formation protein